MLRRTATPFALLAGLTLACASSESGRPARTEEPAAAATEDATIVPRPFTAEEIRDANPPGTWLTFRNTTPSGVTLERFEFGATDGESVQLGSTTMAEDGTVVDSRQPLPVAWRELRDHATFPADGTRQTEGEVAVPAGTYRCKRYAVQRPDGTLETYHFAVDRAGPPVLLTIENGDVELLRMELVEVAHEG